MRKIDTIVIHHNGVAGRTIDNIRRYHTAPKPRGKGWSDVGYHYVILSNGVIQRGRPEKKPGAHARGLNARSIGVCMIGNFNNARPSELQWQALIVKVQELTEAYGVPLARVIGHREVNQFVAKRFRTRKPCPGKRVDMDALRGAVRTS